MKFTPGSVNLQRRKSRFSGLRIARVLTCLKIEYLSKERSLDFRNLPVFIDLSEFLLWVECTEVRVLKKYGCDATLLLRYRHRLLSLLFCCLYFVLVALKETF